MSETVTITKCEYERLVRRDCLLSTLEQVGVDNWSGWGEHSDAYKEMLEAHRLKGQP